MATSQRMPTIQFRPLLVGKEYDNKFWLWRINFKWLLQRLPIILFASVSSYGVGHLLFISGLPLLIAILGGLSFDMGFLGTIALSDMQLKKGWLSIVTYYGLNICMSTLGALFNTLSQAQGLYANIKPEHLTIGIPFAVVGLMFALFYHSIMAQYIEREHELEEKQQNSLQLTKEPCKYCGTGFPSKQAVYGHYAKCDAKKSHDTLKNTAQCKCLLCKSS